jgi:magnesium chelatase subunit I
MTGKFELEYEGEMRGADNLARDLIRTAVGRVYSKHFSEPGVQAAMQKVVQWFELGGELRLPESAPAAEALPQLKKIQGLLDHIGKLGVASQSEVPAVVAAAEFVLEGLWAHRRISRNEERGFHAEPRKAPEPRESIGKPPRRQFN